MKTTVKPELQRRYLKLTDETSEEDEIKIVLLSVFLVKILFKEMAFKECYRMT